ncbi:MAG: LysR family transcriptional regulator [Verrucomicrobiota bacterium]
MPAKARTSANQAKTRLRIYHGERIALGPGKVELLSRIGATGSISEAARQMDMSYNRAWLHIQDINKSFKTPLVASLRGGNAGGGAALTDTGKQVLALYQQLEAEAQAATKATWTQIQELLKS